MSFEKLFVWTVARNNSSQWIATMCVAIYFDSKVLMKPKLFLIEWMNASEVARRVDQSPRETDREIKHVI